MRTGGWMWGALAIGVGVSMYLVKYKVQALENELISKQEQIARDRGEIRVLDAEWTYLNDPGTLRRLSAKYLGFGPAVPQNVVDITALPMRDHTVGGTAQPPADDALTATKPVPVLGPTVHAANVPPKPEPFAVERPVGFPVLVARLQRLLFPDAVGATTAAEDAR